MEGVGSNAAVPVTVITGFLGSGKTTVLNRLLRAPDLADTAVIVNEFGEVGLDHLLIEQAFENTVLLKNGCICCTVRGDIADTLGELFRRRGAGELPWFGRIAIETTGLADPAPVIHALLEAGQGVRLDGVVTTVDAVHGPAQLARQAEARNQVAFADRVVLTKTDLADGAAAVAAVRRSNAGVPIVLAGDVGVGDVFGLGPISEGLAGEDGRVEGWLRPVGHAHHHGEEVQSVLLRAERPVRREALFGWLRSLLSLRGEDVLRLKGVVYIEGEERGLVVQAVHRVLHPLAWLPGGVGRSGVSEIVVISRGLSPGGVRESFLGGIGCGWGGCG